MEQITSTEVLKRRAIEETRRWAKSNRTLVTDELRNAVNAYCAVIGADHAYDNNAEAIRFGREATAKSILIGSMYDLSREQTQKADDALMEIADDFEQEQRRGLHR